MGREVGVGCAHGGKPVQRVKCKALPMALAVMKLERRRMPPGAQLRSCQQVELDGIRRTGHTEEKIGDEELRVGVERFVDDGEDVQVAPRWTEGAKRERSVHVDTEHAFAECGAKPVDERRELRPDDSGRFGPAYAAGRCLSAHRLSPAYDCQSGIARSYSAAAGESIAAR